MNKNMNCTTSELMTATYVLEEQATMLPVWRLKVKSIRLLSLKFKLLVARFIGINDIISVECSLLDTKYIQYNVTRVIDTKENQASLHFEFEFNFINGVYHTLFHSFNGKFNYDNYQTFNQCFEKTIVQQQSLNQLINDYNTLKPNELPFELKFQINKNHINELEKRWEIHIDTMLWTNVYFPRIFPACSDPNWKIHERFWFDDKHFKYAYDRLINQLKSLNNKNLKTYSIKYSTKNIFVGLNTLMSYYEKIRVILQDCVENYFSLGYFPCNVLNLLFEYVSLDKISPTNSNVQQ